MKKPKLLRGLLSALFILLMVASFILAEPKFVISTGMLTLAGLIILMAFYDSISEFSVGQILSLKKEVKKTEIENRTVKDENKELRHELFKMVANVQQSQVNNTFNAPPESWSKLLGVVPLEEREEDEPETDDAVNAEATKTNQEKAKSNRINKEKSIDASVLKLVSKLDLLDMSVIRNAGFSTSTDMIDPIMQKHVTFEAYIKSLETEFFVEVKYPTKHIGAYFDRLYVKLSKVNFYRQLKNIRAQVILLIVNPCWDPSLNNTKEFQARVKELFWPAIKSGLLTIEVIDIQQKDID